MKAIETTNGIFIPYRYIVEATYYPLDNEIKFIGKIRNVLNRDHECSFAEYSGYVQWLKNKNTEVSK